MENYSYWKILVWRFVRAGIAGGLGTVTAVAIVIKPDLSNIKEWSLALIAGFMAGFVSATVKALRDYFSQGDQSSLIQKLPL